MHQLLIAPQRTPEVAKELADGYAKLVDGAQAMLAASDQLTQRAIEGLEETAAQGREKWLYVGLATVGIAIALGDRVRDADREADPPARSRRCDAWAAPISPTRSK